MMDEHEFNFTLPGEQLDPFSRYSAILSTLDLAQKQEAVENQDKSNSHFDSLPNEIAVKIFSYITHKELRSTVALVSKRFYHLSLVPTLWKSIDIPEYNEMRITKAHQMLEGSPALKSLSIQKRDDAEFLASFAVENCSQLNSLSMMTCRNSLGNLFESIGYFGNKVTKLSIWSTCLYPQDFILKSHHLHRISHLELRDCQGLGDEGLRSIADNCNHLEYLNMDGVKVRSNEAMIYLIKKIGKNLTSLHIDGEEMSNGVFKQLDRCKKLQRLSIDYAHELDWNGIMAISRLALTNLRIRRAFWLPQEAYISAFKSKSLKNLKILTLEQCPLMDDSVLKAIAENCLGLVNIRIDCCRGVTDFGLRNLMEKCKFFEEIELVGLHQITEKAFDDVEKLLLHLRVINVLSCANIMVGSNSKIRVASREEEMFYRTQNKRFD